MPNHKQIISTAGLQFTHLEFTVRTWKFIFWRFIIPIGLETLTVAFIRTGWFIVPSIIFSLFVCVSTPAYKTEKSQFITTILDKQSILFWINSVIQWTESIVNLLYLPLLLPRLFAGLGSSFHSSSLLAGFEPDKNKKNASTVKFCAKQIPKNSEYISFLNGFHWNWQTKQMIKIFLLWLRLYAGFEAAGLSFQSSLLLLYLFAATGADFFVELYDRNNKNVHQHWQTEKKLFLFNRMLNRLTNEFKILT